MTSRSPEIVVLPDEAAVAAAAAARVVDDCRRAVAGRGAAALVLSGGSTPRALYACLAAEPHRTRMPWDRLDLFWGDERGVPPDDPRSNYRLVRETLLAHVPVPPERVHPMPADATDPDAAARAYAETLRARVPAGPGGWPACDVVLLGLGADAHTASLFPRTPALDVADRAVVAYDVADLGMRRMTLTVPVFTHAAEVLFIVCGEAKADAVHAVLEGPLRPDDLPAQRIRPVTGRVAWFLDASAARLLPQTRAASRGGGA